MTKLMTDDRLKEIEQIVKHVEYLNSVSVGWWGGTNRELREVCCEIRRLRQEVKDLSQAQFIAEERKETIRLDREAMQTTDTLISYSWPLLARLRLRDRLEAKDD